MRMRSILLCLMFATALQASDAPWCGAGAENDRRALALHERTRARLASLGTDPSRAATLRDGTFFLPTDQTITPGYRRFDLEGQSLVFTPAGNAAFTMRREALAYVEPSDGPVVDFRGAAGTHFVVRDLPFAFPLFGASVSGINRLSARPDQAAPGTAFKRSATRLPR